MNPYPNSGGNRKEVGGMGEKLLSAQGWRQLQRGDTCTKSRRKGGRKDAGSNRHELRIEEGIDVSR